MTGAEWAIRGREGAAQEEQPEAAVRRANRWTWTRPDMAMPEETFMDLSDKQLGTA
jgi:hypothetical protein